MADVGGPKWTGSADSSAAWIKMFWCQTWPAQLDFDTFNLQSTTLCIILPFYLKSWPYLIYLFQTYKYSHWTCWLHYSLDRRKFTALFSFCICSPLLLSPLSNHPCLFSSLLHLYADGGRRGHCSECKWVLCPSPPGHYVACCFFNSNKFLSNVNNTNVLANWTMIFRLSLCLSLTPCLLLQCSTLTVLCGQASRQ